MLLGMLAVKALIILSGRHTRREPIEDIYRRYGRHYGP